MNPRPADAPEPVLLIIADISGYTRYMTANAKTLAHSQTVITELIHAIVHQIELPLEVAKLEGDAVFLFCRKQDGALPWPEAKRVIGEKLVSFFSQFSAKLGELSGSTTCTCHACTHIEKLRLKVVVHSGEALFHRVLNFVELAGVDVIIAHRLLKNSVNADQYLLLTEAARHDLEFPETLSLVESAETYDDLGRINTLVYLPDGELPAPMPTANSFGERFQRSARLFLKMWFAPFAGQAGEFRNVTASTSRIGKILFGILVILLTPIFLPVGLIFVGLHALKSPKKNSYAPDCHEHRDDGSCCR